MNGGSTACNADTTIYFKMTAQKNQSRKNDFSLKIRTFTVFDLILILAVLCGAVFSIPIIQTNLPSTVVIYKDNTLFAEYPLNKDRRFTVDGYEGPLIINIQDNSVTIKTSTCRKQICVRSGTISKSFQQIVCAPNHVLVEIHSKKAEEKIDAITQ